MKPYDKKEKDVLFNYVNSKKCNILYEEVLRIYKLSNVNLVHMYLCFIEVPISS